MKSDTFSKKKIIAAVLLIVFGGISRYLLQDLPNIETITAVAIIAGSVLGGVWTIAVGLIVVALSDIAIGNTAILLYTWTAWAAMGLFGYVLRKRQKRPVRHALELTGMGLLGNLFFYIWTNFGVWQIGGLYPHTIDGLMLSYINGLPFLRYQLIGTAVIVPAVSFVFLTLWKVVPVWNAQRRAARQPHQANESLIQ